MAKRKHEEHEEEVGEAWLLPYADLLTLLLALFIVLFASSNVDNEKLEQMASSFNNEFSMNNDGESPITQPGSNVIVPFPNGTTSKNGDSTGDGAESEKKRAFDDFYDDFKDYIDNRNLSADLNIVQTQSGVIITLNSDIWFASGSAEINASHKNVVKEVSAMIKNAENKKYKFLITVSGYTDNVPISNNSLYKSNWKLSVARAVNFMEQLIKNSNLDPQYISSRGLGEAHPIDTNDTPEGRRRNRRVEIYITFSQNS